MTATTLDYALGYAARGWPVFVLSRSKQPVANCEPCTLEHLTTEAKEVCTCLTCHGFYAATTDPAQITEMIGRHQYGMLAIRTGAVSKLAVVDVDFRTFVNGDPALDDPAWVTMTDLDRRRLLPGTLMQTTGSGGLHLLYAHPGGYLMSGTKKYGPGIDSKADGGYIVAAPSVSRSGPYSWTPDGRYDHGLTRLPEELAAMVRPPAAVPRPTVSSVRQIEAGEGASRARLRGLVTTVLNAADGERNDRLHWAAKKAGEMVAAGEVAEDVVVSVLQDAAFAIGLATNEVGDGGRGTIASGLRKGRALMTAGVR